eukprot:745865-Hanusia_phi.AAC.3
MQSDERAKENGRMRDLAEDLPARLDELHLLLCVLDGYSLTSSSPPPCCLYMPLVCNKSDHA